MPAVIGTIGSILLVIGVVLLILGQVGRPVGGAILVLIRSGSSPTPADGAHVLAGGLMFQHVVDGVQALTGSDPSRVINMTRNGQGLSGCLGSIRSIQM